MIFAITIKLPEKNYYSGQWSGKIQSRKWRYYNFGTRNTSVEFGAFTLLFENSVRFLRDFLEVQQLKK